MAVLTAARGLQTQKNSLARPDGSLSVADNVVIDFDNTIQKRRGFSEYSSAAFSASPKQLISYRSRILTHYENILAFDSTGTGIFSNFSGNYSELITGLRIKAVEANGNLYFTTTTGIKKISAKTASDLSTSTITDAGGIEAIDLSGTVVPEAAGFLPAQSKVAYRLMFGTKDANNNLIRGVPSSRLILTNNSRDVEQSEIFTVNILNFAAITSGQYFLFDLSDQGYFVWFDTTGSTAAPVNADTLDRTGVKVSVSAAATNAEAAAALANTLSSSVTGIQVELSSTEVEVTITEAGNMQDASQGNLGAANILVTPVFNGSITTGTPASTSLTSILPSGITADYFYQLYRTAVQTVDVGQTINDLEPGDEQYFIYEGSITAADITAGFITITDNTPEVFRESGAYLYTNATTGEGIAAANEKPPVSHDIALFRNSVFYANTKDVHRLTLNMLSVDNFVSGTTKFAIGKGDKASIYTFRGAAEVTDITVLAKSETVGNSYIELNSANDEREYYVWFDKGIITNSFDSTADVAGDTITVVGHGLATDDAVVATGTLAPELTSGNTYYAIRVDADNFKLSATAGGAAIVLTDVVGTGTVTHTPSDPAVASKIGIRIPLELYLDTVAESKTALIFALDSTGDFSCTDFSASVVRVTCTDAGNVTAPALSSPAPGWTTSVVTDGDGEDTATKDVLLSISTSVGTAIDLTARSLVRVINYDSNSPVTAQYLTGADDLPGKILLKAKSMEDVDFYISINDSTLTQEFSPELAVSKVISSIEIAGNLFTTSTSHGFAVGDEVYVHDNPGGSPTEISGAYTIATTPSATTFTLTGLSIGIDQLAITGTVFKTDTASDNNEGPNRVYYSKTSQPEAVPIGYYIDVGSKDKPILRILPLRDNLFVLKEDGIYIVTGDAAPNFSVRLIDNSATLIAPDSAVVLNNLIYCLTTQGVVSVSETGVSIISRDIEDLIKKYTTFAYDYEYTSFGVAYESDRAYLLWLPSLKTDTVATQCFRYNSITGAWTRWVLTNTCGIVNPDDDRLYLGKSDRKYVDQERKEGTREDYADRNFTVSIGVDAIGTSSIELSSTVDVEVGDVLVQEQYVTIPKFNRLLKKLDDDPGTTDADYYSTLVVTSGDNLATQLTALITKLNADATLGAFTAPSGTNTKEALKTDFNLMVTELNDPSSGASYTYKQVTDLIKYEVLIEDVNHSTNVVDINFMTWFIQGDITVYKGFECEVQWAPQHFGKPDILKQVREGTLLFEQGTIYGATVSYSSDRSASFEEIPFEMQGPGFWASYPWADVVWGGGGNSVPVRTLIPFQKSRCRFMNVKFNHKNAREQFKLLGISLEERDVSTRGYR